MERQDLINKILTGVGGSNNIAQAEHCMTRLRLTLKNSQLIHKDKLETIDGILGTVINDNKVQIVIGPQVASIYNDFIASAGLQALEVIDENLDTEIYENSNKSKNFFSLFFETVAGIFNPIVPALAGAGLVRAILTILVLLGLNNKGNTYTVINTIAGSIFVFLPFLLASSSAQVFKMNRYVALTIAAAFMAPQWASLLADGTTSYSFLGIPYTLVNYQSSVLPIIFAVWFASYVEKALEKVIPNALKIIFIPALTLLIATPIALMTIGPVTNWIGLRIADIFTVLFEKGGVIAGIIYGGIYSSMVVLGIHHGMVPVLVQGITTAGFNYISPTSGAANMAQAGSAFGVWLKAKNKKTKTVAGSATIAAITGVTEPAIYGINFKYKKPFIAAAIGGAIGGGFASLLGLKAYAMGGPSFLNFPMFIGDNPNNMWLVMLSFAISFIIAAIITYIWGIKEEEN